MRMRTRLGRADVMLSAAVGQGGGVDVDEGGVGGRTSGVRK